MSYLGAVYLIAGAVAALRWAGWGERQHYAIAGPTVGGRVLGVVVVAALLVLLWPLYWLARRGAGAGQHDAAGGLALGRLDAQRLAQLGADPDHDGDE